MTSCVTEPIASSIYNYGIPIMILILFAGAMTFIFIRIYKLMIELKQVKCRSSTKNESEDKQ